MKQIIIIAVFLALASYSIGQVCNSVQGSGFTQDQINTIVNQHNYYRNLVASGKAAAKNGALLPSATNMKLMVWDTTLATVAQSYANSCPYLVHNAARTTQTQALSTNSVYSYVGENIYVMRTSSSTSRVAFPKNVDSWYQEITTFLATQISPFNFTSGTGHFSQVAWAQTTRVGCGYTYEYNTTLGTTYPYVHYVVCDYATGGNYINDNMYKAGASASACESGNADLTYTSLCTLTPQQLFLEQSSLEEDNYSFIEDQTEGVFFNEMEEEILIEKPRSYLKSNSRRK